jgi:DNA-binding ferritin-like protein
MNPFLSQDGRCCASPSEGPERDSELSHEIRVVSVAALTRLLVQTVDLSDTYHTACWQSTRCARPLRGLLEKHYSEQLALISQIVERIQVLGGATLAADADIGIAPCAQDRAIGRLPRNHLAEIARGHRQLLAKSQTLLQVVNNLGDAGTQELISHKIVRINRLQEWSVGVHLQAA